MVFYQVKNIPNELGVNCSTKLSIQSHKKRTNLLIYFDFFELSHDHSNQMNQMNQMNLALNLKS